MTDHVPQTGLVIHRTRSDLPHGSITDSPCRVVDDTFHRLLVIRIGHHAEIGNDILDLLALVETQSAIYSIRYILLTEHLLETTALGIGTIKNGEVAIGRLLLTPDALDVVTYNDRLLLVAVGRLEDQSFTLIVLTIHILVYLSFILPDQTVSCLNDILCTAVVLFQFEQLGTIVYLLEIKNIVDVRTAESIDALRIIPHHANMLMLTRELIDDALLYRVRILILVNQYETEAISILLSHLLMFIEQRVRLCKQVVKVHGVRLSASCAVGRIDGTDGRHPCLAVVLQRILVVGIEIGQYQMVLRHADTMVHCGRLIHLIVEIHLFDDALD